MDKNDYAWGGKRMNIKILRELTEKGTPTPKSTFEKLLCRMLKLCEGRNKRLRITRWMVLTDQRWLK